MKIKYSPDVDIFIFELQDGIPFDSIDISEGIIVHFNEKKQPLEIEILDASKITNIEEINFSLPYRKVESEIKT